MNSAMDARRVDLRGWYLVESKKVMKWMISSSARRDLRGSSCEFCRLLRCAVMEER